MRKPLVAGNWKMHGSTEMVESLAGSLGQFKPVSSVEMVVFPPFVYLHTVATAIAGSEISFGAQNLSEHREGAFTGEIAGEMLSDLGCKYVLVGHSERRALYGESNEVVAEKFVAAQCAGLTPVLCVGETLEQRDNGLTNAVIEEQLSAVMERAGLSAVCDAVIAYEPVWAIGTGRTATPEQAQEVHAAIRVQLGEQGEITRILYGGSVKSSNAEELFKQPDVDGGLVGGASLEAKEFLKIAELADLT